MKYYDADDIMQNHAELAVIVCTQNKLYSVIVVMHAAAVHNAPFDCLARLFVMPRCRYGAMG